jgi:four helix bundle protein
MERKNIIVEKTIDFSVRIIKFCEILEQRKKYVIAKQLMRCGTSIGANVFEAQHAESRADFVHKMKIAIKEANETLYWLILCEKSDSYHSDNSLKQEVNEIIRVLSKIIVTSKERSV